MSENQDTPKTTEVEEGQQEIVPAPDPSSTVMQAFFNLLPDTVLPDNLDPQVKQRAEQTQAALAVLGPAGGAVTVCPGNQQGVPEHRKCPLAAKCDLLQAQVAPSGQLCPLERNYVLQRFSSWSTEMNKLPNQLTETERVTVAELTWIDLQELRCSTILSKGEATRLSQKNVKEVHPETGEHLAWEHVIHINAQLLDQLQARRRMILKDWELTPEMKTKKAKTLGKGNGMDFSSQQSAKMDKLRKINGPIIEG
jgi:hypothetical protein